VQPCETAWKLEANGSEIPPPSSKFWPGAGPSQVDEAAEECCEYGGKLDDFSFGPTRVWLDMNDMRLWRRR